MKNSEEIKQMVQDKYGEIAKKSYCSCCCGGDEKENSVFTDNYEQLDGYFEDADLGLGCGLPTEHADIKPGDHVLDLGAGSGNDCFVARGIVGETGKVTGLDFTPEMIRKAVANNLVQGFKNVDFVQGDIENMPFEDASFDVVISNCVLNLVPDKQKAYTEIQRVLKSGGHFCISDIVLEGAMPEKLREVAALYAGCISGALQKEEYLNAIKGAGFKNIEIRKEKPIDIPDSQYLEHISAAELEELKKINVGIFSITVFGER